MIDLIDIDQRLQNHHAQIARLTRDGWIHEAAASSRSSRPRGKARAGHTFRQTIGQAVVHCGEWLQGTQDAESTPPASINGWTSAGR